MRGINYGHDLVAATYTRYLSGDLNRIKAAGYEILRVAQPTYNSSTATIEMCKDIVGTALRRGFIVKWGVTGSRPVTTANLPAFQSYVKTQIAPWFESHNNPNLHLAIGNEEELPANTDGVVTAAAIRTAIKSLATDVQAIYTKGQIEYCTDAGQRTSWASEGLGNIDMLGFNLYYEWNPFGAFHGALQQMDSSFPGKYYISEWGIAGGYPTATALSSDTERIFTANMLTRQAILGNRTHCVFAYGDGTFGVPLNMWALKARKTLAALSEERSYQERDYS